MTDGAGTRTRLLWWRPITTESLVMVVDGPDGGSARRARGYNSSRYLYFHAFRDWKANYYLWDHVFLRRLTHSQVWRLEFVYEREISDECSFGRTVELHMFLYDIRDKNRSLSSIWLACLTKKKE